MFRKTAQPKGQTSSAPGAAAVTDTAPCQKSVRLQVPLSEIAPVRAAVVSEFQRQATLSGFRKGKAPPELIEQKYAQDIQNETLQRAMRAAFERVVTDQKLKPVGPFEVSKADYTDDAGLAVEATIEVEPTFKLGQYKGIPLRRPAIAVAPEEFEQAMQSLRESMAQLVPAPEAGTTANAVVAESEPAEKQRELPPVNDELAKDLGFENLDKLRAQIEAKLLEQKRAAQARDLEAALCDALLARNTFDVPARLVSHQAERLTRDFKTRLLLGGLTEEQVTKETEQFAQEMRTSATRHVKLSFILNKIAEQESLQATQDELVKRLWTLSQRWKKDPGEVRKIFDEQGLWPSVVSSIRQEKTIALLLSAAQITDGQASQPTTTREGGKSA